MHQKYVCPMHPEVGSDRPGKCSKCGIALVQSKSQSESHNSASHTDNNYQPLIVILLMLLLAAGVLSLVDYHMGVFSLRAFIVRFMTGFFLVFAGFKLMDLKGFVEGYRTYDLLAKPLPAYGYLYPFIELGFGLAMLAGHHPHWLLWTEFAVMVFSGLGVVIKLAHKEKFQCACLGTFLKVPLTYITLLEDFGMALLALVLIYLL